MLGTARAVYTSWLVSKSGATAMLTSPRSRGALTVRDATVRGTPGPPALGTHCTLPYLPAARMLSSGR